MDDRLLLTLVEFGSLHVLCLDDESRGGLRTSRYLADVLADADRSIPSVFPPLRGNGNQILNVILTGVINPLVSVGLL